MPTQKDLFRRYGKRVRKGRAEHDEQVSFIQWARYQHPEHALRLFAVPNGERRTMQAALRLKAEGVTPGVADLLLLYQTERYAGLALEFKRADETWCAVRKEQRAFLYQAEADGYAAAVAFGWEHGKDLFTEYLAGREVCLEACKYFIKNRKAS